MPRLPCFGGKVSPINIQKKCRDVYSITCSYSSQKHQPQSSEGYETGQALEMPVDFSKRSQLIGQVTAYRLRILVRYCTISYALHSINAEVFQWARSLSCQVSVKLYQSRNCAAVCVSRVYKPQQYIHRAVNCNENLIIIILFIGVPVSITKRKQNLYGKAFQSFFRRYEYRMIDIEREETKSIRTTVRDINGSIQRHKDRMDRRERMEKQSVNPFI